MPVVVDVETGGFNHNTDALLEIAAVFIKLDKNGNFVPGNIIHNHIKPFSGSNFFTACISPILPSEIISLTGRP